MLHFIGIFYFYSFLFFCLRLLVIDSVPKKIILATITSINWNFSVCSLIQHHILKQPRVKPPSDYTHTHTHKHYLYNENVRSVVKTDTCFHWIVEKYVVIFAFFRYLIVCSCADWKKKFLTKMIIRDISPGLVGIVNCSLKYNICS